MFKAIVFVLALASLASCEQSHTPLATIKRPHNCKRIVRPLGGGVVYALHIDTAYHVGDTIPVLYTHDETNTAVVIR
jgi:hypothetical protein